MKEKLLRWGVGSLLNADFLQTYRAIGSMKWLTGVNTAATSTRPMQQVLVFDVHTLLEMCNIFPHFTDGELRIREVVSSFNQPCLLHSCYVPNTVLGCGLQQ